MGDRDRSPRYAPPGVLDHLRVTLRVAAKGNGLTVGEMYEHAARAAEQSYEDGYADGWMRGFQEGHQSSTAAVEEAPGA